MQIRYYAMISYNNLNQNSESHFGFIAEHRLVLFAFARPNAFSPLAAAATNVFEKCTQPRSDLAVVNEFAEVDGRDVLDFHNGQTQNNDNGDYVKSRDH